MALDPKRYDIRVSSSRWDRLLFRVEHRLLSPGRSDMARLRGYRRVKVWRDKRTLRERLDALRLAADYPRQAVKAARAAIRKHGARVEQQEGIARSRQLRHLVWLELRHGVGPDVYYTHRLYRPGQLARAPLFLQDYEASRFFRLLTSRTAPEEMQLVRSKAAFEQWLVEHDIPTARTLLEFTEGAVTRSTLPDGRLPRADLFSKPDDSLGGRGTERWAFDGEGWVGEDGRRRSEPELLAEFATRAPEGTLLVQRRLRNHAALAPLAPATLSTVRIITLRGPDGRARVALGVAKIPAGGAAADHMRLGGVAAPIDVESGRLGTAVRKDKRTISAPVERHPDTGATIAGFQMPLWEEAKALAVRAHERLERLVCVGWDIAILEDGPVVIEANTSPGGASSQLPSGIGMGETPVIPALLAGIEASFAPNGRR